jgi:hypothetical protein
MPDSTLHTPSAAPDDGIVVDEHFAALVPPLTPAEHASLEKRLLTQGCAEPMIVWHNLLVDGHHALPICRAHKDGQGDGDRNRVQAPLPRGREIAPTSLLGPMRGEHADEPAR